MILKSSCVSWNLHFILLFWCFFNVYFFNKYKFVLSRHTACTPHNKGTVLFTSIFVNSTVFHLGVFILCLCLHCIFSSAVKKKISDGKKIWFPYRLSTVFYSNLWSPTQNPIARHHSRLTGSYHPIFKNSIIWFLIYILQGNIYPMKYMLKKTKLVRHLS